MGNEAKDPKLLFGQRVREVRRTKGISQENFAHLAKIDRSYMGKIERGEVAVSIEKIFQIALALDVKPSELLP